MTASLQAKCKPELRSSPKVRLPRHTEGTVAVTNLELVQEMFEAIQSGDVRTLERVLDDNLSFTLAGTSPFAGKTVGRDNVLALLGEISAKLGIANVVHGVYEGAAGVVAHQTGAAAGYADESLVLFKIDGGRVIAVVEFLLDVAGFDRYAMAAVAQARA
jgi:ketosteroid isomerase-like protein